MEKLPAAMPMPTMNRPSTQSDCIRKEKQPVRNTTPSPTPTAINTCFRNISKKWSLWGSAWPRMLLSTRVKMISAIASLNSDSPVTIAFHVRHPLIFSVTLETAIGSVGAMIAPKRSAISGLMATPRPTPM